MKEEGEGEIDVGLTLFPSGCPKKSLEWNRNYECQYVYLSFWFA